MTERNQPNDVRWLGIILAVALVARLVVLVASEAWDFRPDGHHVEFAFEWGWIADALSHGEGFSWPDRSDLSFYPYNVPGPTSWMAPVYPTIMGAIFVATGAFTPASALVIQSVQILLSLLACVFVYLVGRRLYDSPTALLAAAMLAVYPPALHFSVQKLGPVTLFTVCLLGIVLLFMWLADRLSVTRAVALGCLTGFAALVEPVILAMCPFAAVWLYLSTDEPLARVTRSLTVVVAGAAVIIAPWVVRNYQVFGEFVFIKSNFGNELYLGNHPGANGGPSDIESHKRKFSVGSEANVNGYDEITLNRIFFERAIEYIKMEPGSFVVRSGRRVLRYWSLLRPVGGAMLAAQFAYWGLLLLAVGGAVVGRENRGVRLLVLTLMSLPLVYYVTHVSHFRYRFPSEVLMMPLAAAMCLLVVRRWRSSFRGDEQTTDAEGSSS